jgi:Asp-tRNA(Asn)/Glu-tRNA(Gln) amidotransferase C subunit
MDQLDLDIDNYNLTDILNLFRLESDFDEECLKQAKRIVLQVHPDKSRLPPKYFLFYSKAYKVLYNIYEFRNKSSNKKEENYAALSNEEKNKALASFFEKNKSLQSSKGFNNWFNEQFEKNKQMAEHEANGYGDWLKSEEDTSPEKRISQAEMAQEFSKKKQEVRSLIVHRDISDLYANNLGASNLTSNPGEAYSSDLFSKLSYQDLKQAHVESVIPVTEEDYHKVKKFNNVNEYVSYRNNQEAKPLSEMQAMEYLKNRTRMDDQEASQRAYELAKQVEQAKQKNKSFWGNILNLTNDSSL